MKADDRDSIVPYLPTNGWLGKFLRFTDNLEVCPRFRFFSACCALGSAINNKAWIQRGDVGLLPKLFPNPWLMLIAPPGRGHKTTAINMATNCLMQACPEVRILSDKLTPEYLVKALSAPQTKKDIVRIGPTDATGLIKAPELSVFFGRQQYNVGLVSLVTDLYDFRERWVAGTIGRGSDVLLNVCISIIGGSTPEWLLHMLPQDAFSGGFMSRFIMCEMPPKYNKRDSDPKKPKEMEWGDIVKGMRKMTDQIRGEFTWGSGSKEAYDKYYNECEPTGDAQKDAYREREPEQILKIAMIMAINDNSMNLTGEHIRQAIDIMQSLHAEVDVRIERLTTHPRMHLVQEMQDVLKMTGEISESELLKRMFRSLSQGEKQFYETLSVLKRSKLIEVVGTYGNYSYKLRKEK